MDFICLMIEDFCQNPVPKAPNSIKCAQSCMLGLIRIRRRCQGKTSLCVGKTVRAFVHCRRSS
jgi:hypothetical protein